MSTSSAYAAQYTSSGSGNWNTAGTWSPAGPPGCGDTVFIQAGHTIEVSSVIDYSACGQPLFLEINGHLHFNGGGSKLRLPGGSGLNVYPGGSVYATGGGGGASKTIEIGAATVWSATMGTQTGPAAYGTPLASFLLSFNGGHEEGVTKLTWTVSGYKAGHFIIQKAKDGAYWTDFGLVNMEINTSNVAEFEITDDEIETGIYHYKLLFMDSDGNIEELGNISVQKKWTGILDVRIVQNSTNKNNIELAFTGVRSDFISIYIFDSFGLQVYTRQIEVLNENFSTIETLRIGSNGMYVLTIVAGNSLLSKKLMITGDK